MRYLVVFLVLVSTLTGCNTNSLTEARVAEISANAIKTAIAELPTQKVEESVPPVPTVSPVPTSTPVSAPKAEFAQGGCKIIHESLVDEGMDHVSTSGDFIHLEYWYQGQPEREVILPAKEAAGGRFNFTRSFRGWVWEYVGCSYEEVKAQVDAHITRRLAGKANNAGFVNWKETGFFVPVPLS